MRRTRDGGWAKSSSPRLREVLGPLGELSPAISFGGVCGMIVTLRVRSPLPRRYPVAGSTTGEHLPVATTRPETILGDTAVAVHPEDERYKWVGRGRAGRGYSWCARFRFDKANIAQPSQDMPCGTTAEYRACPHL